MEFFKQNVLLIGLALGSGIALLWPMLQRSAAGISRLSATEAVLLMNQSKALVLDVREPDEFAQGHLQGARNVPLAQLTAQLASFEKHRAKPVVLVCSRGSRAFSAAKILKAAAFSQLHVLQGGVQAWQAANLPLVKAKASS